MNLMLHSGGSFIGRHSGQTAIEYLLACGLLALAFHFATGEPLANLVAALGQGYERFSWSMAQP